MGILIHHALSSCHPTERRWKKIRPARRSGLGQDVPVGESGGAAGWYADPWSQALLRWWDGTDWTGHTLDGSSLPPPPTAATTASHLEMLLAGAERVAVVDVETTGLYNSDRVVEVAIVTMDAGGTVIDEFETLINPGRDVGPTWLHQVTASMLVDAPSFDDVAHHVASRLDGAVCVAHNLRFDRRMLSNEFEATGITIEWGQGLDTLSVTGCKLGVASDERGIAFEGASHSALADARATARLLLATSGLYAAPGTAVTARPLEVTPMRVHTRQGSGDAAVPAPYLAALAAGVHAPVDVAPYVDLLDTAIGDLQITADEQAELWSLAVELGLDRARVARAHNDFINALIDAALEDDTITDEEYDQLTRAAALLGVDQGLIARRTDGHRSASVAVEVAAGIRVCFTGAAVDATGRKLERSYLEDLARSRGYVPTDNATKTGCDLLVASDPASQSGKAAKARKFGIPIVSLKDFLAAREAGTAMAATHLSSAGTPLVCIRCGSTWLAARGSSTPVCRNCKADEPRRPKVALDPNAGPNVETLTCEVCGSTWDRTRSRGRKPLRCTTCR